MVSSLLHRTELNNTLVHLRGQRDDGSLVGRTAGSREIVMPAASVCILDFKEDVELIQQKGRSALTFAHPDKWGCQRICELLFLIVRTLSNAA